MDPSRMEMGMEPRGAESVTFAAFELAAIVEVLITCTPRQSSAVVVEFRTYLVREPISPNRRASVGEETRDSRGVGSKNGSDENRFTDKVLPRYGEERRVVGVDEEQPANMPIVSPSPTS